MAIAFRQAVARLAARNRDISLGAPLAAELDATGTDVVAIGCDVSDPASVAAAADAVLQRFGPADVLVNNAAMLEASAPIDPRLASWNRLLSVNLSGYFLCAQVFARRMKANGGGTIVHTGSVAGNYPQIPRPGCER